MLTCPLLASVNCVDAPAVLSAHQPLALIGLPAGEDVDAIPMRHVLPILPHVPVPIWEGVGPPAMPLASLVVSHKVGLISTLLHTSPVPQSCNNGIQPEVIRVRWTLNCPCCHSSTEQLYGWQSSTVPSEGMALGYDLSRPLRSCAELLVS